MRTKIPLAPREPDVTVYIVVNDFGPLGSAFVETDEAEADEATIIENILSGQYRSDAGGRLQHRGGLVARCHRGHCTCRAGQSINEDRSIGVAAQAFLVRALELDTPTAHGGSGGV